MTSRADRWIKYTTTGCVALLALIAGTVSYLHMHALVALHGQPSRVAALTPLSVDGMIVATSTTLLADSRSGGRGGVLPWALLAVGSVASLAANVAVAEPTATRRVIAVWPSFALIGAYEMLMRQVGVNAAGHPGPEERRPQPRPVRPASTPTSGSAPDDLPAPVRRSDPGPGNGRAAGLGLRRDAWLWAEANRAGDGSLPSGREIARRYGRHERWGRLVKRSGLAGEFTAAEPTHEPTRVP
jgi:hypothetical protein